MKIKKIKTRDGRRRDARVSANYLISAVTPGDAPEADDINAVESATFTESVGPRVVASGSLNTLADDFAGGRNELESLNKIYKGRGDAVGHYMMAWRSGEIPTREQKAQAIDITLKNLGYRDHACLWVEHGDKPHPHIHLLVSRLDPDANMPRIGGAGASVGFDSTRHGVTRRRDHEEFSCARAEAEICREQGWKPTPNALYGPDLLPIPPRPRDPDGLKLRPRVLDYEARYNKSHPTRILGKTTIDILRNSKSWYEANLLLSKKGIVLERLRKGLKNKEGAILRSENTRLKLSALPSEFSLKNLDQKWGTPVSKQKPEPSIAESLSLHGIMAKSTSEPFTINQIKTILKKCVSESVCWEDFLNDIKRQNWSIVRAGGGALIIAGEHRLKMSQIPGKCSYGILCKKWGQTIENAALSTDLLELVHYHEAVASYTPEDAFNSTPRTVKSVSIGITFVQFYRSAEASTIGSLAIIPNHDFVENCISQPELNLK